MALMHLCYSEKAELFQAFPGQWRKELEYSGMKFKQADDKISQPICWPNAWRPKKKKKEKKTIFHG